jgi:hypothetical protein
MDPSVEAGPFKTAEKEMSPGANVIVLKIFSQKLGKVAFLFKRRMKELFAKDLSKIAEN